MPVLVLAEHDDASLKSATLHAITAARAFGGDVHVLVAGRIGRRRRRCVGRACRASRKVLRAEAP